jgi:hypothetical protein
MKLGKRGDEGEAGMSRGSSRRRIRVCRCMGEMRCSEVKVGCKLRRADDALAEGDGSNSRLTFGRRQQLAARP